MILISGLVSTWSQAAISAVRPWPPTWQLPTSGHLKDPALSPHLYSECISCKPQRNVESAKSLETYIWTHFWYIVTHMKVPWYLSHHSVYLITFTPAIGTTVPGMDVITQPHSLAPYSIPPKHFLRSYVTPPNTHPPRLACRRLIATRCPPARLPPLPLAAHLWRAAAPLTDHCPLGVSGELAPAACCHGYSSGMSK